MQPSIHPSVRIACKTCIQFRGIMQVAIEHFCPEGLIKCSPVSPRAVTDLTHDWQSCVIYLGLSLRSLIVATSGCYQRLLMISPIQSVFTCLGVLFPFLQSRSHTHTLAPHKTSFSPSKCIAPPEFNSGREENSSLLF